MTTGRSIRGAFLIAIGTLLAMGIAPVEAAFSWDTLEPGHWYEIPNTHLGDVQQDTNIAGGFDNIIAAWGGGAYDTTRDYFIIWGGGHTDYAGNEIYGFDVNALRWVPLAAPYPCYGGPCGDLASGEFPDGSPRARHSYNNMQYVPSIDMFCTFGGAGMWPDGGTNTDKVHCIDFDEVEGAANGWVRFGNLPIMGTSGTRSAYDPSTGHVWVHTASSARNNLLEWDPIDDTWTDHGFQSGVSKTYTMDVDPVNGRLVSVGSHGNHPQIYYSTSDPAQVVLSTSGPKIIENTKAPGFVYHPPTGKFVAWGSGTTTYTFEITGADSAAWTACPPAPSNSVTPTAPDDDGTFGRFRYIPSKDAFVLVNDVDENVFVYKLSASCGESGSPSGNCGNGVLDAGEVCDPGPPEQLNGATCESLRGASSTGDLDCAGTCLAYDLSSCTLPPDATPPPPQNLSVTWLLSPDPR